MAEAGVWGVEHVLEQVMGVQLPTGIAERVARAEELKEELQTSIDDFCSRRSYDVLHEIDSITGLKTATFRITEGIPPKWSVLVGDIIHNLRSSLDQAVYHLSVQHIGRPVEKSEFPVFMDREHFEKSKPGGGRYKIRGLKQSTQSCIEAMQPYHVTGQDQVSTLWLLHQLSNIDKHRQPHFCRLSPTMMRVEVVKDIDSSDDVVWNTPIGILPDRTVLVQWKPVGELDTSEVIQAAVDFQIVFDPAFIPNIWTKPAIEICDSIITGVKRALNNLALTS